LSSGLAFSLEPAAPFADIETLWKDLQASQGSSFFTTWTWLGTWLSLLPDGFKPRLLRVTRGGQTISAAFLVPRKVKRHGLLSARQLHFNSTGDRDLDCVMIEHNGFAGPHHSDPQLWPEFIQWFSKGKAEADELVISGVENSLLERLPSTGLLQRTRCVPAFRVPLRQLAGKGGFESALSRNSRQQLRRAIRDYRSLGELVCEEAPTIEHALVYFEALKELHIRSWNRRGKPHAFRYAFFEEFHRALIRRGVPERSVQLLRIAAGGRPIGYLYNFRHRGKIYAYQSGFDDSDPAFRPGYVSHALAIEAASAEGAEEYDFLAGSNRLKRSLAADNYIMSWCTLQQPKFKFRVEAVARSVVKGLAGGLRR